MSSSTVTGTASTALALVLALFTVVPSAAQTDDGLTGAILHELSDEGIRTVDVTASGATVTLSGDVDSLWEKRRAEELALDHDEVDKVVNDIRIESDRSDASIGEAVARRLRNYVHYSIFDNVNVHVLNGEVTLTGDVTWGYKVKEMENMAARVPGVRSVDNEIQVLPNSANDAQLRRAIASRIYNDSLFINYSSMAVPPIHIIVENGRVTLTGVVATPIEKRRAEQIARSTFGVFSVTNELRVDSASTS